MNACCPQTYTRPRLFNWITIVLVTAWVGIVGVIAETRGHGDVAQPANLQEFVEYLVR